MGNDSNVIDLSQQITSSMPLFPGYPQPVIEPYLTHGQTQASGRYDGCSCQIDQISFVSSTGTYMDAPAHFFPGMKKIGDYPLDRLIMEAVVLDCRAGARADGPIDLQLITELIGRVFCEGRALLLETGWSDYWGSQEYFSHPFLNEEAVNFIIEQKPLLVGIDTLVIDDRRDKKRPAHCGFLGNEILIVENLTNLSLIRNKDVEAYFIPLNIEGVVSMPVRAFAREI